MLDRQGEFPNHVEELRNLIGLGFAVSRLQAERARHLRMGVDVMAATDPAKPKAETFDEPPEFGETDVAEIAPGESVPQLLSSRTPHGIGRTAPSTDARGGG